jgi:ubiquinone/menaquinone biosynthesis C-methylase UbiE
MLSNRLRFRPSPWRFVSLAALFIFCALGIGAPVSADPPATAKPDAAADSKPDSAPKPGSSAKAGPNPSSKSASSSKSESASKADAKPDGKSDAKIPPPLKSYRGREIAQTMHYTGAPWLVRESRQREEDCRTMLKALRIKEGETVCDMGCGNGFYSLKLAEMVGKKGEVLAVDIQPEMLHLLKLRAKAAGIENIRPILGTTVDPDLPEGKVDLILCVDVYHEFSNPEEMLAAMRKSLKPHGRLALVEFRSEDPKVPILPLHKMSKEQILKELPPNGFKLVEQFDKLPWQHLMFFEADASDSTDSDSKKP